MGRFCCDSDSWVCSYLENPESETEETQSSSSCQDSYNERNDDVSKKKKKKKNSQVLLEGYVESVDGGDDDAEVLKRTKSLTGDDLEELKGCLDLGFGGFSYEEIPGLCNTLPALELCYSMSQKFLDHHDHQREKSPERTPPEAETAAAPIASWKISSPGDNPDDVKARLKFWAQAVACTVRLCK